MLSVSVVTKQTKQLPIPQMGVLNLPVETALSVYVPFMAAPKERTGYMVPHAIMSDNCLNFHGMFVHMSFVNNYLSKASLKRANPITVPLLNRTQFGRN